MTSNSRCSFVVLMSVKRVDIIFGLLVAQGDELDFFCSLLLSPEIN